MMIFIKNVINISETKINGSSTTIMDLGVDSSLVSLIPITINTENHVADILYPKIGNMEKNPIPAV